MAFEQAVRKKLHVCTYGWHCDCFHGDECCGAIRCAQLLRSGGADQRQPAKDQIKDWKLSHSHEIMQLLLNPCPCLALSCVQ